MMMPNENQTFLWHRKEWILWLLLCTGVTTLRALHHIASIDKPFEGALSQDGVRSDLQQDYCYVEVRSLCELPLSNRFCPGVYAFSLGPALGVDSSHSLSSDSVNCTLLSIFTPRFDWIHTGSTKEEEMRVVVNRMIYSFQDLLRMWGDKEDLLRMRGDKEDTIDARRWMEFFLGKFYCLFGYQPGSLEQLSDRKQLVNIFGGDRDVILMSDPNEWTTDEFLQMVKVAVQETEQRWRRDLGYVIQIPIEDHVEIGVKEVERRVHQRLLRENDDFQQRESKSRKKQNLIRFLESLTKAQSSFEDRVMETTNAGDHVCRPATQSIHKGSHRMFFDDYTNQCMINHFHRQDSLLSNGCQQAMQLAPPKLQELDLEGMAGFLHAFHFLLFVTNCASFLVLFTLLTSKQRLERKMDRERKRLEQELNDPFLRQSLERNAAVLPEAERQQLISRLEAKLTSWDSQAAVAKLLRHHVFCFRLLVLLTLVVTTLFYLILHLFRCSSLPRYLEMTMMSTGMMAVSYWVPYGGDSDHHENTTSASENLNAEILLPSTNVQEQGRRSSHH